MYHDNEEWCKIWKGTDLSFQNCHKEFDKFWPEHSKVSKIFTLMRSFWAKYIMFELKKYRAVIFDDIAEWWKIWRKTDWWFEKWHEKFGKFSPEHLEVSKSDGVILSKIEKVWVYSLQRSYLSWQLRIIQNLKRNWLVLSKMTRLIWQNCTSWNKWIAHLTKLFINA